MLTHIYLCKSFKSHLENKEIIVLWELWTGNQRIWIGAWALHGQACGLGNTHTQYFVYSFITCGHVGGEASWHTLFINPRLRTCKSSVLGFYLKTPPTASKSLPSHLFVWLFNVVDSALNLKSGETGSSSGFFTESPCDLRKSWNQPVSN